ncbi:MAG TPA: GNAT family N-acetyltransferase [Solirubrobacteraceae bacterium]|nr:GNAT family N-acetyltransferase [Solirubrobacteraceae bacterium]
MARLPFLSEPLDGGDVRVRDAAERDIPEVLIAFEDDPAMHLRLGHPRPPSGAQLGRLAETEATDRAAGSRATLTILEADSDLCLGQVAVHDLDWDHARATLSPWVAPQARGRGLAAGAVRLIGGWLLGRCGLVRVQVLCEADNQAMLRAGARAGLQHEGVLMAYRRLGSRRVDVAVLSLIAADLKAA